MSEFKQQLKLVGEALDASFTKDFLQSKYATPARKFITQHSALLKKEGAPDDLIDVVVKIKNPNKAQLAQICAVPFGSRTTYEAFLQTLDKDVRQVWEALIWEDRLDDAEIEKQFGIKVYELKSRPVYYNRTEVVKEINPRFGIFLTSRDVYYTGYYNQHREIVIGLPFVLRQILAEYYDLPENAELTPVAVLPATEYCYESGESDILLELPRVLSYKEQGQINYTVKDRPSLNTLPKMTKSLSIREFFPKTEEKRLKTLRTLLIAGMALHIRSAKLAADTAATIRMLFRKAYADSAFTAGLTFPDLKGMGYIDNYDLHKKEAEMLRVLATLPTGGWVPFENVQNFVRFHLLDIRPMREYTATDKLYYEYETEDDNRWENKHHITKGQFSKAIELPYLRGSFFIFAAFGLCDIAYDAPDLDQLGRTCYSSWDGLRFVRRTALGDYVCGFSDSYDASKLAPDTKITLSPDTLLITTEETDNSAAAILDPYTERIGANRFRTDNQIFLKNIRSKKELEGKIALFKQIIGEDLPPNWAAFFQDMLHKINPFEPVEVAAILQIPTDNKALIQLIAQDPVLKTLIVKAEGYMIVVPKGNYAAMKRRLQEFGYLLT
jgi:hypothetical protein